jgi:hypothetical protein
MHELDCHPLCPLYLNSDLQSLSSTMHTIHDLHKEGVQQELLRQVSKLRIAAHAPRESLLDAARRGYVPYLLLFIAYLIPSPTFLSVPPPSLLRIVNMWHKDFRFHIDQTHYAAVLQSMCPPSLFPPDGTVIAQVLADMQKR